MTMVAARTPRHRKAIARSKPQQTEAASLAEALGYIEQANALIHGILDELEQAIRSNRCSVCGRAMPEHP